MVFKCPRCCCRAKWLFFFFFLPSPPPPNRRAVGLLSRGVVHCCVDLASGQRVSELRSAHGQGHYCIGKREASWGSRAAQSCDGLSGPRPPSSGPPGPACTRPPWEPDAPMCRPRGRDATCAGTETKGQSREHLLTDCRSHFHLAAQARPPGTTYYGSGSELMIGMHGRPRQAARNPDPHQSYGSSIPLPCTPSSASCHVVIYNIIHM